MDYRELIDFAPVGCRPIVVDTAKDYLEALKKMARDSGKMIDELTGREKDDALHSIGLCDLDFYIP